MYSIFIDESFTGKITLAGIGAGCRKIVEKMFG
jgi:hypothetical protein